MTSLQKLLSNLLQLSTTTDRHIKTAEVLIIQGFHFKKSKKSLDGIRDRGPTLQQVVLHPDHSRI